MKAVCVTDYHYASLAVEQELAQAAGAKFDAMQLKEESKLAEIAGQYDAFLNTYLHIGELSMSKMKPGAVIVRYGIGVDNVDLEAAKAHGIVVCNVPDYGLAAVSEYALSAILSKIHQLDLFNTRVRQGNWDYKDMQPVHEFSGYKVGLLGFGGIGRTLAGYLTALKFNVLVYDPFVNADAVAKAGCTKADMAELLGQSDVVSLHMPLTEDTRHLINADTIAAMKDHAVLVNTARGPLVDPDALASALNTGKLSAAVLDVFEQEPLPKDSVLYSAKNLTMTPHVAWYTEESTSRLQRMAGEEIARAIQGQALRCPLT